MPTKTALSTTIRRMKDDDIACQMVLRYNQNPARLYEESNLHTRTVHNLAQAVIEDKRYPETVGEWVSLVMLYGHELSVRKMRDDAERSHQSSYTQSERWLQLIDRVQVV